MRSLTKYVLTTLPIAVVGAIVYLELPNIRRYLKIRNM